MFKEDSSKPSLPADVLWGSFVTHSWRNECLTNEPQRTSAGRLQQAIQKLCFNKDNNDNDHNDDDNNRIIILIIIINGKVMTKKSSKLSL